MKNLIYLLLIPFVAYNQTYPNIEEFNTPLTWSVTNGAGIQNYGLAENYLTTNIGTTPYPNSSNITMTSSILNYSNCATTLTISFPLSGIIENNFDFMRFQYSTDGGSNWNTLATYTGTQNTIYSYVVPNTANRFRFRLTTDNTINTYGHPWWNVNVYYYDIANFTVNCISVTPVELVYFRGFKENNYNTLEWKTEYELNNDYFEIYQSEDAINFELIGSINGSNNGQIYYLNDYKFDNIINYYKLVQIDNDGTKTEYNTISIDNRIDNLEIISTINILGQKIDESYNGIVIITYSNGTIKKILK